jgi:hypothetical protein
MKTSVARLLVAPAPHLAASHCAAEMACPHARRERLPNKIRLWQYYRSV